LARRREFISRRRHPIAIGAVSSAARSGKNRSDERMFIKLGFDVI
jgi:hypothetical protein